MDQIQRLASKMEMPHWVDHFSRPIAIEPRLIQGVEALDNLVTVQFTYAHCDDLVENVVESIELYEKRIPTREEAVRSMIISYMQYNIATAVQGLGWRPDEPPVASNSVITYSKQGLAFSLSYRNLDLEKKSGTLEIAVSRNNDNPSLPEEVIAAAYASHLKDALGFTSTSCE